MNSVELIYKELKGLLSSNREYTKNRWTCEFIIDGEVIPTIKVFALDRVHDYEAGVMEAINIMVEMSLGSYNHDVYPNRKKATAVLYKTPLDNRDGNKHKEKPTVSKVYNCVFLSNTSATLTDGSEISTSKKVADREYTTKIQVQLIDPISDDYRQQEVSCILRNVTVLDAMELLLTTDIYGPDDELPKVITPEAYADKQYTKIVGREITPPDNLRVYKHIVIPTGTKLVDLPDYLQVNYGVYRNGLGNYYYNGIVYVYPIYDTERIDTTINYLTIARFPPEAAPSTGRTWILKETMELYVAATADVTHNDFSDWVELNSGIISYTLDSEVVLPSVVTVEEGVASTEMASNLLFTDPYSRQEGDSHVSLASRCTTCNTFFLNSKINAGRSGMMSVTWENSNPDFLYPGMPVRYIFPVGDVIGELRGTLILADSETTPVRDGLMETEYITNTKLAIKVESIGNL